MGMFSSIGNSFKTIGAIGAAPFTGGASLAGLPGIDSNGYSPNPYQPTPPLQASGIGLPKDLESTFSNIGTAAKKSIGSNYGRLKSRTAQESKVRGTGPNSYAADRYGTQQGLDTQALESGLAGEYGNTAYTDVKNQRDYNQNLSLTDQIARAMKPSTLDEILGGVGGGANAFAQYAPFLKRGGRGGGSMASASGPSDIMDVG